MLAVICPTDEIVTSITSNHSHIGTVFVDDVDIPTAWYIHVKIVSRGYAKSYVLTIW